MKAILPVLDKSSNRPLYLQLYDYLKEAILSGSIAEGERLPSLRGLAHTTGLSLTTVEKAYSQLLVEGYIHSRAQSGFYADRVSGCGEQPADGKGSPATGDDGRMAGPRVIPGSSVPFENTLSDQKLFDSSAGSAETHPPMRCDPDCFDFNKWKKCMNRILNDYSSALFFEGSPQGEISLREEIARHLYQSRGFSCRPDQIFIGAGTQQITGLLATILRDLDIGHVALESPGYTPVRNTFRDRGFAITDVAVNEDGLSLEKLPVNIRAAAYVTPSNHAFTGSVMPIGRRYEMIRWAIANDSYIIEDDYDSELRYFGRPIPPIRSLEGDERVIYLGSFSSTLFAAVRISYMVLPAPIARTFARQLAGYSPTCSKLEQLTLAMFMETGLYQTHIRKLRKLYAQKLTLVLDILRREASDFVGVRSTSSGIGLLLQIRAPKEPTPDKRTADGAQGERTPDNAPIERDADGAPAGLRKYIADAESLGIRAVPSHDLILLYYNPIPLSDISGLFRRLIRLWRS